jgi:hypothetical protein
MKKLASIALAAVVLTAAYSAPADAYRGWYGGHYWHGGRAGVSISVGPGWGPWWGTYYPYYSYYSAPPMVIQQQPETYIQQDQQTEESPYWYYCKDPKGYYPYVNRCPTGWSRVVPSPAPSDGEE